MIGLIEQWKLVDGWGDKYAVSENGRVIGYVSNKMCDLNQRIDRAGYKTVRLHHYGITKTIFVHRLVATYFSSNPNKLHEVNHINGNKTDNRSINLHWVNHSMNITHAHLLNLIPRSSVKKVIDTETGEIFSSIKVAATQKGISYTTAKNYLNGNRKNKTSLRYLNN
jgi:hypothetical protein